MEQKDILAVAARLKSKQHTNIFYIKDEFDEFEDYASEEENDFYSMFAPEEVPKYFYYEDLEEGLFWKTFGASVFLLLGLVFIMATTIVLPIVPSMILLTLGTVYTFYHFGSRYIQLRNLQLFLTHIVTFFIACPILCSSAFIILFKLFEK